ncbi:MAG TPA: hypothetical protein VEN81_09390 [Planctomycetota bacterium]|nr:hypothetical protein [Planctomycetota bacterium]
MSVGDPADLKGSPRPALPGPLERARARNVWHLWVTFLVFTVSTGILLWWIQHMPRSHEEIGFGRAIVSLGALGFWLVGFIFTLIAWLILRKAEEPSRTLPVVLWGVAILWSGAVVSDPIRARSSGRLDLNERNAASSLKAIATAEAEFRNREEEYHPRSRGYWVGDVSTLYTWVPEVGREPIKLIDISTAGADQAPLKKGDLPRMEPIETMILPMPKAGYSYRALTHYEDPLGKKVPYHSGSRFNADHFGFCASPLPGRSGSRTFILNEGGDLYWKDLGGERLDTFPAHPEAAGWKKLQ